GVNGEVSMNPKLQSFALTGLRLALATAFLSTVAGRLGLWGKYGSGWVLGQVRGLRQLRELVSSGQDGPARCHHNNDIRNSLWVGFARRLPNTQRCAGQRRIANAICPRHVLR